MPATTEHPDSLKTSELSNLGKSNPASHPSQVSSAASVSPARLDTALGTEGTGAQQTVTAHLSTKGMAGAAQKSLLGSAPGGNVLAAAKISALRSTSGDPAIYFT